MMQKKMSFQKGLPLRNVVLPLLIDGGVIFFVSLCIGAYPISVGEIAGVLFRFGEGDPIVADILLNLRLPRTLLAYFCGAGLACCGVVMQALLRNPLAEPFIVGTSSGAVFGAVFAIALHIGSWQTLPLFAFAGALGSTFLVITIASFNPGGDALRFILIGIAVGALFNALSNFIITFAQSEEIRDIVFWTMGSFTRANPENTVFPVIVTLFAFVFFLVGAPVLNVIAMGEENAYSLGVDPGRARVVLIVVVALVIAFLSSVCGIIGFVGIVVPHLCRMVIGAEHHRLLPVSFLFGGAFMVLVDIFCRLVIKNSETPVGVVTGFIGSLFLLTLLGVRSRYGSMR